MCGLRSLFRLSTLSFAFHLPSAFRFSLSSLLYCSLFALLVLCIPASAHAQGTPDIGSGTCDDINPANCGGSSSSGSSSGTESSADFNRRMREEREERAERREAEAKRRLERQLEKQADAERRTQEELARKQAEALRLAAELKAKMALEAQQKREAAALRRQAAFTNGKASALSLLKDEDGIDDSSVVDLRGLGLKDDGDITVPILGNGPDAAWVSQITNPAAAVHARRLAAFVPPQPISSADVPVAVTETGEPKWLVGADLLVGTWQVAGKVGSKLVKPLQVGAKAAEFLSPADLILIGGKSFIAAEDGARIYLDNKDRNYENALRYLKDPQQSKEFARLVQDVRAGRPFTAATSDTMMEAARAIADPKLNASTASIVWDAMTSPEALSAAARKAIFEVAGSYVTKKVNDLAVNKFTEELVGHKTKWDMLTQERHWAIDTMKIPTTSEADRAQLKIIVNHANNEMGKLYRLEQIPAAYDGIAIGPGVEKAYDKINEAADRMASAILSKIPHEPDYN